MSGRRRRTSNGLRRALPIGVAALLVGTVVGAGATLATDALVDDGEGAAVVIVEDEDPFAASTESPSTPSGDTATVVPDPGPITIAFVGDINAEPPLGSRLIELPTDFVGPFAPILHDADLVIGNLEAAITEGGRAESKQYAFRVPPSILDALEFGGVDVVSVANNHGRDFGAEGLDDTLAARAARADDMVIGVGVDEDDAYAPFVRTIGANRVGVIAATQVLDADLIASWTATETNRGLASAKRVDRLVQAVDDLRPDVDTLIVFLHWGVERDDCPSEEQADLAEALADAGADIVVGSHAHRVQGGGMLGDTVVHYGLGNFLFYAPPGPSARTGVFTVTVDAGAIVGYEWIPGRIRGSVPEPLDGQDADAAVAEWEAQRDCTGLEP